MKRLVTALFLTLLASPAWATTVLTTPNIDMSNNVIPECTATNVSPTKSLAVLVVAYRADGTVLGTDGATLPPSQSTTLTTARVIDSVHCTVTFQGSAKSARGAIVSVDGTDFRPLAALPAQ